MTAKPTRLRKRWKAVKKRRATIAWTREQWINEAESVLGRAMIVWFELRLAERNRLKRFVFGWTLEFDRVLFCGMIDLRVHPVRREFNRATGFEEAISEMGATAVSLRRYVEKRFPSVAGPVQRGLADADVHEFWKRAREAGKHL